MTFYEALDAFETLYLDSLAVESKRVIDIYDQQWQTICNEFNCYNLAIIEGDTVSAQGHIDNILAILAENDLTVDPPVPLPLAIGLITTPSTIPISCDSLGSPTATAYDNSYSVIKVYTGIIDDTINWTFSIDSVVDVTANIQNSNEVWITSLSADNGTVIVRGEQSGYSDILLTVTAFKVLNGTPSYVVTGFPDNIMVPDTGSGPSYANAVSYLRAVVANVDDTTNWSFSISGVSNVTASILNDNEVWLTNITAEGYVDVEASKTGFDTVTIRIPCYLYDMAAYYTKTESDARYYTQTQVDTNFVSVAGAQTITGAKTFSSQVVVSSGGMDITGGIELTQDITQTGSDTNLYIDPNQWLSIGRNTNDSSFRVFVYNGDGTSNYNHVFCGADHSAVCLTSNNFGVGAGTPEEKLDVRGSIQIKLDSAGLYLKQTDDTAVAELYHNDGFGSVLALRDDSGVITGLIRGYASSNTQAYFNEGNVGIGVTIAGAALDVAGDVKIRNDDELLRFVVDTDGNPCYFSFYEDDVSTQRAEIGFSTTGDTLYFTNTTTSGDISISTDGISDNFYMLDDGNVGIGTTTPGDHKTFVYQTTDNGTSVTGAPLAIRHPSSASSDVPIISFYKSASGPSSVGYLTVGPSGPTLVDPSDQRLKTDINYLSKDAIQVLKQIPVREFYWKTDVEKENKIVGYVANENEDVINGFVHRSPETGMLGVSTSKLIPYMHKAIQQLSERVEKLEKIINEKGG